MDKLKVITVVGTRPEIIRLSRIIPEMDKYFNHKLIHTVKIMIMFVKFLKNLAKNQITFKCGRKLFCRDDRKYNSRWIKCW